MQSCDYFKNLNKVCRVFSISVNLGQVDHVGQVWIVLSSNGWFHWSQSSFFQVFTFILSPHWPTQLQSPLSWRDHAWEELCWSGQSQDASSKCWEHVQMFYRMQWRSRSPPLRGPGKVCCSEVRLCTNACHVYKTCCTLANLDCGKIAVADQDLAGSRIQRETNWWVRPGFRRGPLHMTSLDGHPQLLRTLHHHSWMRVNRKSPNSSSRTNPMSPE